MRIDRNEEETLRQWNKEDPVDAKEMARNDRIENFQHNRNPFVDCPEFIDRISDF
jgi:endonuclease I